MSMFTQGHGVAVMCFQNKFNSLVTKDNSCSSLQFDAAESSKTKGYLTGKSKEERLRKESRSDSGGKKRSIYLQH